MNKLLLAVAGIALATPAMAQDYPLHSERPKPLTATLVGVCEHRELMLMVAIFTYTNGAVLRVDSKDMKGFASAAEIVTYASSAGEIKEYAQTCGDAST